MKFHDLVLRSPRKKTQRVGRGNGSGRGSYSGRGVKGQKARSGYSRKPGFEGGQSRLIKKIPKNRGFRNPVAIAWESVTLLSLEQHFSAGDLVNKRTLVAKGLVTSKNPTLRVKLLSRGTLSKKLTVFVDNASKKAVLDIQKAGGTIKIHS